MAFRRHIPQFVPLWVGNQHWAVTSPAEWTVARVVVEDSHHVVVKLNPTDCRCYRIVVQLVGETQEKTRALLNVPRYNETAELAVFKLVNRMRAFFQSVGLEPQAFSAGNNAHSTDATTGQLLVGQKEPSMAHWHVLGRGDPESSYVADVPLRGPAFGQEFNLKGDGDGTTGFKKVPWSESEKLKIGGALMKFIESACCERGWKVELGTLSST